MKYHGRLTEQATSYKELTEKLCEELGIAVQQEGNLYYIAKHSYYHGWQKLTELWKNPVYAYADELEAWKTAVEIATQDLF